MSEQNQLAVQTPPALLAVAGLTGLDKQYLVDTIKRQCFKGTADDAQVDAFISIACEMKVNPLLPGMLYAYPISGGGIVPIMGPSGVYKKLMEHPEVDSWETEVFPADVTVPPTHAVTRIYRKGRDKPLQYTALLSEWKINSNPNWNSRPRHMLALRSLKHCANQIIHGIPYDEDDRVIMGMQNVTGTGDEPAQEKKIERAPVRERAKKGAAAIAEVVVPAEPADIQQAMQAREEKTKAVETPVKQEPAPKPAEPAPEPAPALQPRAFLKPDERGEFNVEVVSIDRVVAINVKQPDGSIKQVPSVEATVKGDFNGFVRHYDGATWNDKTEKDATALPCWKPGTLLTLSLWGRALSTGKVLTQVESVKPQVVTEEE